MPNAKTLDAYYKALNDQELLKLSAVGGFTEEAEQSFAKELARRNLTSDEAKRYFAPEWLDKADVGTVSVLVLESGERITAEVAGLNEEGDRLSIKVISSDTLPQNKRRNHRTIPIHQIVSFEPQPNLMEQWPFSDPCRRRTFSLARFLLMSAIFLSVIVGSIPLFLVLTIRPYGLQEASIISYSLLVVFSTFARIGSISGPDLRPYMFTCPAVRPQIPSLLWRHLGFLIVLFVLQIVMLAARQHLPDWWNMQDSKGTTPFDLALMLLCYGLGFAQAFTNRSLLDRAHREFSA
jgi:hypothetical protein